MNDRARTTRILPGAAKATRSVVLVQPEPSGKSQRRGITFMAIAVALVIIAVVVFALVLVRRFARLDRA